MTEFTILGNLKGKYVNSFTLEEGKEVYVIHPAKGSTIMEELEPFEYGTRMKVCGIMKGSRLYCQRATIVLGMKNEKE